MRAEREMFDLILGVAKEDELIRSVIMFGSRANIDCPKDIYQDYDICYYVTDTKPFFNNMNWIKEKFGTPAVVQLPEMMAHPLLPPENDGHFTYLMIFEDGNRIDLSIEFKPYVDNGEPAIILLDKDNSIPPIKTDKSFYYVKPPQEKIYADACNEFWWCLNNVAKGIARDELPYVMEMFNHYVRDMLNQMVQWDIGIKNDFNVSPGKMGKYYKRYLPKELYQQYVKTYNDGDYENIWAAIFTACDLFRSLAKDVAAHFGYTYNRLEDANMMKYIYSVKNKTL
jgi:aminoglycoside 6-adenylyltransferase